MEGFAIVLTGPIALGFSLVYGFFAAFVLRKWERVRRLLLISSLVILGVFLVELGLIAALGAVGARAALGPGFYAAHLAVFFLGTPALANVLILRKRPWFAGKWYVAAFLCAVFAVLLVLLQYGVSEALYGVDGTSGPFS